MRRNVWAALAVSLLFTVAWLVGSGPKSLALVVGLNTLEPAGATSLTGQCVMEGSGTLKFAYVAPPFTFNATNSRQVIDLLQPDPALPVTVEKTGSAKASCVWVASRLTPSPT